MCIKQPLFLLFTAQQKSGEHEHHHFIVMGGFICFYMSNLSNYISMHGPVNTSENEIKSLGPNLQ